MQESQPSIPFKAATRMAVFAPIPKLIQAALRCFRIRRKSAGRRIVFDS
jgi:hypothetical protein